MKLSVAWFMVYPVVQFKRAFSSRQQKNPALIAGLKFFVIPPRLFAPPCGTHEITPFGRSVQTRVLIATTKKILRCWQD